MLLPCVLKVSKDAVATPNSTLIIGLPVKKNAQENKEKLGPRWSSWVGHAIKKLEGDGILEASSAAGSITLTASGRKAITDARQTLCTMTETLPSAVPEELVWKHLTQATPVTRGTKRGRPSVRLTHDEEEYVSPRRATRSKRPRVSAAVTSPPKPARAQITKSQLLAQLHALQKEKENGLWLRESSPLTDLDEEEEPSRLRDELMEKQEEIDRIKRELAAAKLLTQPYRPLTPTIETRPSSPTQWSPGMPALPRPLDLSRTQSGSRISLLSRQPTPPRSPGAASDEFLETMGTEESSFVTQGDHDMHDSRSPTQLAVGTATSAIAQNLKVIELEHDLASPVAEIESLEAQLSQLQANVVDAQQALFGRDEKLSALSASFTKLQNDASQKALDLERQVAALQELGGFETFQASRVVGLEQDINERNASIVALNKDLDQTLGEMTRVRNFLGAAEQEKASLAARLVETDTRAQTIRAEMEKRQQAAGAELQAQRSVNTELTGKVETSLARISALDAELYALRRSKDIVDASLLDTRAQQTLTSDKLRDAEANNESLLGELRVVTEERADLKDAFGISETKVAALSSQVLTLEKSVSQGETKIVQLTEALATAERYMAAQRDQATTTELVVSALQSELVISKKNADELAGELASNVEERAQLISELGKARTTISASASSVIELKEILATTTSSLVGAESRAAEFQANLNAITHKLNAQQEVNRGLVEDVEQKKVELAQLSYELSTAETSAAKHRAEAVVSDIATKELRTQLSNTENELREAEDSLSSTEAAHALESEKKAAEFLDLEGRICDAKSEIDALRLQLSSSQSEKEELQNCLIEQSLELGEFKVKGAAESERAGQLEAEVIALTGKLEEVDEELLDLKASKLADEATIENLKGLFSTHVEKQQQSLAVLNSQVISTKSSPAPPKRRSARTTGKAIPFKIPK
ncbi:hypothetical protein DXG01_014671 [Tephrocybe rancida]|nr:hypothetical protein DXG01_014671 [Tephrocybe rancida]